MICFPFAQNTPESYKILTTLLEEAQAKGSFISRHAYCFAVTLALRQVSQIFSSYSSAFKKSMKYWNLTNHLFYFCSRMTSRRHSRYIHK